MNHSSEKEYRIPSDAEYAHYAAEGKRLLAAGTSIEKVIQFFRSEGLSKVSSMRALRDAADITLNEAKTIVHDSPTWAFRKETDDRFQEQLWTSIDEMGKSGELKETAKGGSLPYRRSTKLTA